MMDALLIIAAEKRELTGLLARCDRVRRLAWPLAFAARGELRGLPTLLAANGPGPELAAQAVDVACGRERVRGIVSVGTCGALDPVLRPCEIFVALEIRDARTGFTWAAAAPRTSRQFASGGLLSADRVACTAAEKKAMLARGARAVDMETAGVAARASERSLPFYCVRAVLDGAGESFTLDFNALRASDGRFSTFAIIRAALAQPRRGVPELIRLRRRLRRAAGALGGFIADCEF